MQNSKAILACASFIAGFYLGGKSLVGMINKQKDESMRNRRNMELLSKWLDALYDGWNVDKFFEKNNYKNILIYGNGLIGQKLYKALNTANINVVAIMDKQVRGNAEGILIGADSNIPYADCIVITPICYYNQIYCSVRDKTNIPIVSVEDIFNM
ncbi:MAG: hypothetical protein HFH93_01880 [Lachnospiraceae bacterium]|nr:hypothetical protein [Lachnospiraceae bacterium]